MKLNTAPIVNAVKIAGKKAWRYVVDHKAQIFYYSGMVVSAAGAVWACEATAKKLPEANEECKKDILEVRDASAPNKVKAYAKCAGRYLKVYAIPTVLYAGGQVLSTVGFNEVNRDLAAMSAAYATLLESYRALRVKEIEKLEVEPIEVKEEKETEEAVESSRDDIYTAEGIRIITVDHRGNTDGWDACLSPFCEIFDETNPLYNYRTEYVDKYSNGTRVMFPDKIANKSTLIARLQMCDFKLRENQFLTLNEAREAFGFKRISTEGIVKKNGKTIKVPSFGDQIGWVYDPFNPKLQNKVDIGLFLIKDERTAGFISGEEDTYIIDFMPDGIISDYMKHIAPVPVSERYEGLVNLREESVPF